jgi:hypothetical protein
VIFKPSEDYHQTSYQYMDVSVHVHIITGKERIKKSERDHNIFYPKGFLISHIKWRGKQHHSSVDVSVMV